MGRWVYGLDHNGRKGEGKEAEDDTLTVRALASGYGAEGLCLLTCLPSRGVANRTQHPFSPTHLYGHSREATQTKCKQAGENKRLKEVRKGEE